MSNVSLINLPGHSTDVVQPLDMACFSTLKSHYVKYLTDLVHKLIKPAFCNLTVSIWRKSYTNENILPGFQETSIYPTDVNKYKKILTCVSKIRQL